MILLKLNRFFLDDIYINKKLIIERLRTCDKIIKIGLEKSRPKNIVKKVNKISLIILLIEIYEYNCLLLSNAFKDVLIPFKKNKHGIVQYHIRP